MEAYYGREMKKLLKTWNLVRLALGEMELGSVNECELLITKQIEL